MNQELIIELAMQAGFVDYELDDGTTSAFDKRYAAFAALVRADEREFWIEQSIVDIEEAIRDEREACAKVCDELPAPDIYSDTDKSMWEVTCMDCSEAIRARGEKK